MKSKMDYLKTGSRVDGHLTFHEKVYEDLQILSIRWKEPMGKILDKLIIELCTNQNLQDKIREDVRNYR
jgi:hypothetical protein